MATGEARHDGGAAAGGLAVLLVVLTGVATWCAMGPQAEAAPPGQELDVVIEVADPPRAVELAVGLGAAIVAVGIGLALWRRRAAGGEGYGLGAIGAAGVAGAALGFSGRLITAKSVGANIGGGLALIGGLPTAVVLTATAFVLAWKAVR
jgi:hypothetical protein